MKNYIIVCVVSLALGAAVTRYYFPQVDTKVEIQEKEVIKKDIKTIIKEVVKSDGTKETVTEIIDNSKESKQKEIVAVTIKPKDWIVAISAITKDIRQPIIYGAQVQKRMLGPIYLGASVNTDKQFGILVGLEF